MSQRKTILQLDFKEAREFFLKEESYHNFDLPPYIQCEPLLRKINEIFDKNQQLKNLTTKKKPENSNKVNYKLFHNKNGEYDWRIFELINPILYVCLVREITDEKNWKVLQEHFSKRTKFNAVKCHSIPIQSYNKKSDKAEQRI